MTDKLDASKISYVGPLSEDEYLDVVLGIQKAMAVEPFHPSLVDVVKLLSDWRTLTNEIERLQVDNAELSGECDQYQAKLTEVWGEVANLRAELARYKEC